MKTLLDNWINEVKTELLTHENHSIFDIINIQIAIIFIDDEFALELKYASGYYTETKTYSSNQTDKLLTALKYLTIILNTYKLPEES
jgi:hypothetical protein